MKKTIVFFLSLLAGVNMALAQRYTTDVQKFGKEFSQVLGFTGDVRKGGKSMAKEFLTFWMSDSLTPNEKNNFITQVNKMADRNCKNYPEMVYFTDNAMLFCRRAIDRGQYDFYIKGLNDFVNKKNLKPDEVPNYLKRFNDFLGKNIVASTSKNYWEVQHPSFRINYADSLIIEFTNTDLVGHVGKDSVKIYNTDGIYNFKRNRWNGFGGKVTWEKVGYSADSVNAVLENYNILNMKNVAYSADTVTFNNLLFYKKPMRGSFADKASNISDISRSDFPQFKSSVQHYEMKNLVKGVDYQGGFSILGRRFVYSGTKNEPACMSIRKNDTIGLKAYSKVFYIKNDIISSDGTRVVLSLGENDSIFHPYVLFRYLIPTQSLELIRTKEDNMSKVYFRDTYHKLNMDFTLLTMDIDNFVVHLKNVSQTASKDFINEVDKKYNLGSNKLERSGSDVLFESFNFYTIQKYKEIQKHDMKHPLEVLTDFGHREFKLNDLARYMKYNPTQVLGMVMSLAYTGFLEYDEDDKSIRVFPEAYFLVDANRGVEDFDILQFAGTTPTDKSNAELSLTNFDLKMEGVKQIHISDTQNVTIYPRRGKVTIQKGLSFLFDGIAQTSQFYYYGSGYRFDYDNFKIDLNSCDSVKMITETNHINRNTGKYIPTIVRNKLENVAGTFYIDAPGNKSGKTVMKEFPKFVSTSKETRVFFDRHDIQKGIYKRNNFYFAVDPFEKDGLRGYSRMQLTFAGTFFSGDIFPPFKETLIYRNNDNSLGFNTHTPPTGFKIYGGKAKFTNEIDLSNHGLRGFGRINFLTTTLNADTVLFLPQEMRGFATTFDIAEQTAPKTEFPAVDGKDVSFNFDATTEKLDIKKDKENLLDTTGFQIYTKGSKLDGNLSVSPDGLAGEGTFYIESDSSSATIIADNFHFGCHVLNCPDSSSFNIFNSRNLLDTIFGSDFVRTRVDFKRRLGVFQSQLEGQVHNFPRNQYVCSAHAAIWNMDTRELRFASSKEIKNIGYSDDEITDIKDDGKITFTSTNPTQDGLTFDAVLARYNFDAKIIEITDVDTINVADAYIINASDKTMYIRERAEMDPLSGAVIVANKNSRYHRFFDVDVKIHGRYAYLASGKYHYYDAKGNAQTIKFESISPDVARNTVGKAAIDVTDNFMLSPNFKYFGNVALSANEKLLSFNGQSKIITSCNDSEAGWVKFDTVIDPYDINIPIAKHIINNNGNEIYAGLMLSNKTTLYPVFLDRRRRDTDEQLFQPTGVLAFDTIDNKYLIGPKDKINERFNPGTLMSIHKTICNMYGEGRFNLSNEFGSFEPNAIGNFYHYPDNDSIEINLTMIIDAYFNQAAYKLMCDSMNSTKGLAPADLNNETFKKAMIEFLGTKDANEFEANLSIGNYSKYPKALEDKFVISDINLVWNKKEHAFYHYGPVAVINAGKYKVNKFVWCMMKISKLRTGDIFEMAFELGDNAYYYFRYTGSTHTFSACSSDAENFNNVIYNSKDTEWKNKTPRFHYGLTNKSNYFDLKKHFEKVYGK